MFRASSLQLARPRPTAVLSPNSDGKPEAATAVVAPNDGCEEQCCWSWSGQLALLARPRPTALLSPNSDGKPEAATAVVGAPDDGHEDAQNMLSCI
jgi:hypothetical protein